MTGKRTSAMAVKQSCSFFSWWRKRSRAATSTVPSVPALANTLRSMPALKCLPSDDSTAARTPPASSSWRNSCGISAQKAGVIALWRCGWFMRTCATAPSSVTSKQVQVVMAVFS